jgi:hypothetical protein
MNISTWIRAACLAAPVALLAGCGGGGDLDGGMTAKAVTVDSNGVGFVGKGDVQLALGWSNKKIQDGANSVTFRGVSSLVQEVSWVCTNSNNQNTQERARTTTTETEGIVKKILRERNQVTGFFLEGFEGSSAVSSTTEGPAQNSCPGGSSWSLTTPAGAPVTLSSSWKLEVSGDGSTWVFLYEEAPETGGEPVSGDLEPSPAS